jgi:hypothetical protein
MFFRVLTQIIQFALQFDDRLFEIELMFHAWERLTFFEFQSMQKSEKQEAGLSSGLSR